MLRACRLVPRPSRIQRKRLHTHADRLSRVAPILQQTQAFAARTFAPTSLASAHQDTLLQWAIGRVNQSIEDDRARPLRIGVYELDPVARAKDVVSALLDDPFSSDADSRQALRERWHRHSGSRQLLLTHGDQPALNQTALPLRSTWLRRLDAEVLELSQDDDTAILDLLQTDIPLVVSSGLNLNQSLHLLEQLRHHPTAIIVINNPLTSSDDGRSVLKHALGELTQEMRLRLVDASSTLGALDSIRNTQDPRAVQTFQDLYLNSNIASLARAVEDDASASPRERIASLGLFVASYTLHSCRATNLASHDEAERVSSAASKLHNDATAASVALANGLGGEQSIATELKKAELNVRAVTNGLQWWHVPLNLDDVSYIVKRAVDSFWGIELEKKLAFFAGRLQSARTTHMEQADGVLNNTPVAFKSALLLNEVEQARSLPSATITPDSLSVPIVKRRELLNAPTTALHRRAQSLVLSTGATSFVAVSMSYAAWASSFLDAGSAVGLAALVSVGTLRWSISRWERAQRRWWEAWDRIVQSLARDIQAELRRTLADGVFLVPNRVADGLLESTNRRLSDLADKNAEETRLSQAVDALVVETRASHQNAMSSAVRMPEVSIAQPKLESIQTMQH